VISASDTDSVKFGRVAIASCLLADPPQTIFIRSSSVKISDMVRQANRVKKYVTNL
jgi:hypothetical protein